MKLRIILVDDNTQMAGVFVVQERRWFGWEDLYFDKIDKILRREQVLGRSGISQARFDKRHDARKYALAFKAGACKRVVKQTWVV
jgi:hypothetical protein